MQTIQQTENNGAYTCDIGVTREEWLAILLSPTTRQEYIATLLRFFYLPDHKGSCVAASRRYGGHPQSLNRYVTQFGTMAQRRLGRFRVVNAKGQECWWPIPMGWGRKLGNGDEGSFEWQLRPELADALRDYLYHFLLEKYRQLRRQEWAIDGSDGELYKWKLIDDCKGKDLPAIARRVCSTNLIDAVRDASIIRYMVEKKPDEYRQILTRLVYDQEPLDTRLHQFRHAMIAALPATINGKKFVSKANDERTASALLACTRPQDYTFYKYEDVYNNFCRYLGVDEKPTGHRYSHFLALLQPLKDLVEHDHELQEIIGGPLSAFDSYPLLLAQDVLWMMMVNFQRRLDFVYSLVWRPVYWLVGYTFEGGQSQLERFKAAGVWEGNFAADKRQLALANKIKVGDVLVLKSTFVKGKTTSCVRIAGIGIVAGLADSIKRDDGTVTVQRAVKYINFDKKDFDGSRFGKYLSTVQECREPEIIDYVNTLIDMNPSKKYANYINLLKANHNLVLTGAPGTGKTYMAREIAQEMNAKCDLVQFHPSYDYTDFVEGLRPVADGSGNVGFERRDGVFKAFCARAYENVVNSRKSQEALAQEVSVRTMLDDFIEEAMEKEEVFKTLGTKNDFYISGHGEKTISIDIPGNDKAKHLTLFKVELQDLLEKNVPVASGKDIQAHFQRPWRRQEDSYLIVLYERLKKLPRNRHQANDVTAVSPQDYVFIIDEINRGDISKIFGELFFAIDPGYRGEAGRVDTQYQNMVEDGDPFAKGFFVPDNVYIIGTMNDIDRSVESMDFAMRRRFVWQEVTAEQSYKAMIEQDAELAPLKDEISLRMHGLNAAILDERLGLGEAYQIGAAYFRKVIQYADGIPVREAFDKLWENHLRGLLAEYLRGSRDARRQLEMLHQAYNATTEAHYDDSHEGQLAPDADA